jgi:hypothetical protein
MDELSWREAGSLNEAQLSIHNPRLYIQTFKGQKRPKKKKKMRQGKNIAYVLYKWESHVAVLVQEQYE